MNRRMVLYIAGKIVGVEAALLMLPLVVSLIYQDGCTGDFLLAAAAALCIMALTGFKKPENTVIYAREGFAIVALAWLLMSAVGALPFFTSGQIPSYIDCLFEMVSGFTTTGATILTDVEVISHGLLFWRSFSHWVGGMGVLVFALAIIPLAGRRSMFIMRAEVPGPVKGKLAPKLKDTAKILYAIYMALSVLQLVLLIAGGMPVFDSFIHMFGSAGTGGFSNMNLSVGAYNSPYIEWVIAIFMALFGINFNIYYFLLIKNFSAAFKNSEMRWYLGILVGTALLITVNISHTYSSISECFRHAFFQVSSIMTTTGYATANFDLWPQFSKTMLLLLMFIGASAGSTGGGIKVARVLILYRAAKKEIQRVLHPRAVSLVEMDEKSLSEGTINGTYMYLVVYLGVFVGSVCLVSLNNMDFVSTFSAVAACFNNIGPGLGIVGPMGNFSTFNNLSKLVLTFSMLLGRLELFPLIFGLSPAYWMGKAQSRKVSVPRDVEQTEIPSEI